MFHAQLLCQLQQDLFSQLKELVEISTIHFYLVSVQVLILMGSQPLSSDAESVESIVLANLVMKHVHLGVEATWRYLNEIVVKIC